MRVCGGRSIAPVIGLEFNLALRDERYLHAPQARERMTTMTLEEPGAGVALSLELDSPATILHFPIETVSESEEGLERTYQGLCLVCLWSLPEHSRAWRTRLRWIARSR